VSRKRAACALGLLLLGPAGAPLAAQAPKPPAPAPGRERLLELAAAELSAGRRAEASRLLRSAAERFHSVKALMQLARLQAEQQDAPGALASLRRAREIAPNSEEVLSALAQLSLGAHVPVQAILALEPLTRMCPGVAQYHYLLGVAQLQAGDLPAAVESLERAERLEPDRVLTLVAMGLALNGRKRYADAKPHLLRSLELEPDSVEAVAALAESEEGLDELQQAEAHAQRALARAAGHAGANFVIGMVRMKQERYAAAREALARSVAEDPASAKAHYQLSLACARLGDEAGSREHLELYRKNRREMEERVKELRRRTGIAEEGRQP
jgi:tetratricopeptide (TPR) repeat protein